MKKYIFLLIAINMGLLLSCGVEDLHKDQETPFTGVVASFEIENNGCETPCEVSFINNSTNATDYEWDFGDGNASEDFNPIHTYALPGDYTVSLKAINNREIDSESKPVSLTFKTFKKTFGGLADDFGYSVQQTQDGGYILLGNTESEGAGDTDMYLIKTDNAGDFIWKKTFGGTYSDSGKSVHQTQDRGYILLGFTYSEGAGSNDMYLIKTDNVGNLIWKKTFGGTYSDFGISVQQTQDGGYILLGDTKSRGAGSYDMYLIKVDNMGSLIWEKTFGGSDFERGFSVQQTQDRGYILLGFTYSEGAGSNDMYLVKTDKNGIVVWSETFGGTNREVGYSVQQTQDGGYILLGNTESEGAGDTDMYLIKTNDTGNLVWKKTFGGIESDVGSSVRQTQDGGYILLGNTKSEGAGDTDMYLIKTDNTGNFVWKQTFGGIESDVGRSVQQTQDGGYIFLGDTKSEGAGNRDMYLIKTDSEGNVD